jgi:hypothetical protein
MTYIEKNIINIKNTYLPGMRVKLVKMNNYKKPPIGMEGTIRYIDDTGSAIVTWDDDSWANVVLGEDEIEIISESEVYTLYSQEGDITFIMDRGKSTAVVGFYYGEPDEEATKLYRGKLSAYFE